jgi:hypothetical protein
MSNKGNSSDKSANHKNTNQMNKSNKVMNNHSNTNKKKSVQVEQKKLYNLIPIFFILCIIPLIVKCYMYDPKLNQNTWFPKDKDSVVDLFLYYKQRWFIIISYIVAGAAVIKTIMIRKSVKLPKIFIPLAVYAILALLSAVVSKYASFSFTGSYEMFESVFALLGYCLIVYYCFLFLEEEHDFKLIVNFLTGVVIILGILGVFQFLGYDFFSTQIGINMIIPSDLRPYIQTSSVFGKGIVYMTLFNPDYVGVYAALVTPILFVMLLFQKRVISIILISCAVIGLVISAIGSHSLAGTIGFGVAIIVIMLFMWRHLVKRLIITVPLVLILVFGLIFIATYSNHYYLDKVKNTIQITKTEHALTDIHTEDDGISLTYHNNILKIKGDQEDGVITQVHLYDQSNVELLTSFDDTRRVYIVMDERFSDVTFGCDAETPSTLYVAVDGSSFGFQYSADDGKCYYMNPYNQMDQMITAPSVLFKGHESFASGRGYIWSRTIPLLKNYILLGSGPDTFTFVYPQQDYMNMIRYGFGGQIMTKPHSMYLQMAVQTGVLSLIAFLVFYGMYFASSIFLYIRGRFTSYYAKLGLAIFIGTFCYMVTGITNDSNINTAPVFWTLMGVGIAVNLKAKPLILKEIAEFKAEKAVKKKKELEDTNSNS